MNSKLLATFFALIALASQGLATPILSVEFDWTPQAGFSQYSAMFLYGGGTTVNGVFTPNSLITYSIGTPFGVSTPNTGPVISFFTDTPYGPSFQTSGIIEPINYQNNPVDPGFEDFEGNNFSLAFQNQKEVVASGQAFVISGTWTETIVTAPDTANSLLLLGLGLAALGGFHAFPRARATAR
jgi:hypothetical protein